MSEPALRIEDLWVSFRGITVLESINMVLPEGEFLGVIGPNGAGKTVLLKTVLGLLKPDRGRVRVFGKRPDQDRGLVAYVPQTPQFDPDYPIRVRDVVLMGRLGRHRLFGRPSRTERDRADEAMTTMKVIDLANRQVGKLSGGQLQRVLISRALVQDARLLILDEPTASLDTRIGVEFYDLIREVSRSMTLIMVSHDLTVLTRYVTSIACLNRRLHYHGAEALSREVIEQTYGYPVDLVAHAHGGGSHHPPGGH